MEKTVATYTWPRLPLPCRIVVRAQAHHAPEGQRHQDGGDDPDQVESGGVEPAGRGVEHEPRALPEQHVHEAEDGQDHRCSRDGRRLSALQLAETPDRVDGGVQREAEGAHQVTPVHPRQGQCPGHGGRPAEPGQQCPAPLADAELHQDREQGRNGHGGQDHRQEDAPGHVAPQLRERLRVPLPVVGAAKRAQRRPVVAGGEPGPPDRGIGHLGLAVVGQHLLPQPHRLAVEAVGLQRQGGKHVPAVGRRLHHDQAPGAGVENDQVVAPAHRCAPVCGTGRPGCRARP